MTSETFADNTNNVLNSRPVRWALVLGVLLGAIVVAAPAACDVDSDSVVESTDPETTTESAPADSDDVEDDEVYELTLHTDVVAYYEKVGFFRFVWNFFTHIREFLEQFLGGLGNWAYFILWSILFMETGLVVMAFLPGDSLLFATGTLAAWGHAHGYPLDLRILLPILISGPIMGDSCNYWIGRLFEHRIMSKEKNRFFKKSYIEKAHAFYARHGGKAVAIGRFLPLIRTFVPFVAGVGKMNYKRFLGFSVVGSIMWINICVLAGWALGSIPFVKEHFETIIVAIVLISITPAIITFLRSRQMAAIEKSGVPNGYAKMNRKWIIAVVVIAVISGPCLYMAAHSWSEASELKPYKSSAPRTTGGLTTTVEMLNEGFSLAHSARRAAECKQQAWIWFSGGAVVIVGMLWYAARIGNLSRKDP